MAPKRPFVDEDFSCSICCNVFVDPVLLPCSHSYCSECVESYWKIKRFRECPLCRKVCTNKPPHNLALKNLCAAFLDYKKHLEGLCEVHEKTLSLFCCVDKQLVCELCRESGDHREHTCRPIHEVAAEQKLSLRDQLTVFTTKMVIMQRVKYDCDEKTAYLKHKSRLIESLIRKDFKKLHQLLNDEEKTMIDELRQEKEQKLQYMKHKLTDINRDITSLSGSIKDFEQTLESGDIKFLQTYKDTLARVRYKLQDPEVTPGELIDHAKYIGNLKFNVWKKIRESLSYTPVVLDPNTVNCQLQLSDDLTEVRNPNMFLDNNEYWAIVPLPTNLERFENYPCVLGSVGFSTGIHSWDVEMRDNRFWMVGVAAESVQRKQTHRLPSDIWTIGYDGETLSVRYPQESRIYLSGYEQPKQMRVKLDMSEGQVSFSDPQSDAVYHTFTHNFGEKVFPFFYSECVTPLKIMPVVNN